MTLAIAPREWTRIWTRRTLARMSDGVYRTDSAVPAEARGFLDADDPVIGCTRRRGHR
ncbi:MAG: hypothetical protein K8W52_23725 [Deltaproteobacteria bacterium]|nr:hypothetical protein [Deltaproteobacteria bacterium]